MLSASAPDRRSSLPPPPSASSEAVRAVMRGNRRRDSRPELALRSELHARGLRYRVDFKVGSGRSAPRPDIAFIRVRVAVFVDGCFWHGCHEHGVAPSVNRGYWRAKFALNKARDARDTDVLTQAGWVVIRVWEHEAAANAASLVQRVVEARRAADGRTEGCLTLPPDLPHARKRR